MYSDIRALLSRSMLEVSSMLCSVVVLLIVGYILKRPET